jgi:hypothetical protein
MTVLSNKAGVDPALFGQEGELVSLRIAVEPRLLEDLLEALAALEFPVNPELFHRPAQVIVEFPAYSARLEEVRSVLRSQGFNPSSLAIVRVLARTAEN